MASPRQEYLEDSLIMHVIKTTAQKVADKLKLPYYDANDAEQDLHCALQKRVSSHDTSRANLRTFATCIIRNQGETIIKFNRAAKRGPGPKYYVSLDAEQDPDRRSSLLNHEVIAAPDFPDWRMQRSTDIRRTDLSIDLHRALGDLPARLRATADALESTGGVIAEAADELGVHRSVVYERRVAIREHLEKAGLGEYLTE